MYFWGTERSIATWHVPTKISQKWEAWNEFLKMRLIVQCFLYTGVFSIPFFLFVQAHWTRATYAPVRLGTPENMVHRNRPKQMNLLSIFKMSYVHIVNNKKNFITTHPDLTSSITCMTFSGVDLKKNMLRRAARGLPRTRCPHFSLLCRM